MAPSQLARALALILVPLSPAVAADVLVVDAAGGGAFTDIPDAVAAAGPGDVVLVRSGTYSTFAIDGLSLTVTADRGASVVVQGSTSGSGVVVSSLAAGGLVVLRGLAVVAPGSTGALVVADCAGAVLAEDCTLLGEESAGVLMRDAVQVRASAAVTLVRCQAIGGDAFPGTMPFQGGHGLSVVGSSVHLFDCTLEGGNGTIFEPLMVGDGGDGGRVGGGGFLYASGTSFLGGDGGPGSIFCTSIPEAGDGGAGLRLLSGAPRAELLDTDVQGGAGGASFSGSCPPGSNGPDLDVKSGSANTIPGVARTLRALHPAREGETLTFEIAGLPGELAVLGLSGGHAPLFLGALEGSLLLAPAGLTTFVLGTVPGSGLLSVGVTVPPVTGATSSLVFAQLAVATPAMPTDVRLGTGQALVLLDASL